MAVSTLNDGELLTVEEFAARLKVGRSTVFDWLARGRLKPGVHFLKIGRTLRFVWHMELLLSLSDDTEVVLTDPDEEPGAIQRHSPREHVRGSVVNLDF
jgi:excisionase family DNA binding protein